MNLDLYTINEIKELIKNGKVLESEVSNFYKNQWWADNN